MREARLQELEEMAAALLATAGQLPRGQQRDDALLEIGSFRAQIAALKGADKAKKWAWSPVRGPHMKTSFFKDWPRPGNMSPRSLPR
jgi:hypothetical protein